MIGLALHVVILALIYYGALAFLVFGIPFLVSFLLYKRGILKGETSVVATTILLCLVLQFILVPLRLIIGGLLGCRMGDFSQATECMLWSYDIGSILDFMTLGAIFTLFYFTIPIAVIVYVAFGLLYIYGVWKRYRLKTKPDVEA